MLVIEDVLRKYAVMKATEIILAAIIMLVKSNYVDFVY